MTRLSSALRPFIFTATLFVLCASHAPAQEPAQTPAATAPPATTTPPEPAVKGKPLSPAEKKFFKDVSDAILVEQQLADLARRTAVTPSTKGLGEKVNGDLAKAWEALATLSMAKGADLTLDVGKSNKSNMEKLGKLTPEKFDKEFLKDLGKETKKTARLFEMQGKTMQDPDVKKWVSDWTPTLKLHDADVERVEKEVSKRTR